MMNFIRYRHTFSHRSQPYPPRPDVSHLPAKKPIPAEGHTSAKQLAFRPVLLNNRTSKDWTAIAWPTNIQSATLDGRFGPARQMQGWEDCCFLASLAAVANNKEGQKILTKSIRKVTKEDYSGYAVTFAGSPKNSVFISDAELRGLLEREGGDADTRLMELAADRFFKKHGNTKSLYLAALMSGGANQLQAEQCFQTYCQHRGIQDPMTYNPMRHGIHTIVTLFMLTGRFQDRTPAANRGTPIQTNDVMRFLNRYETNSRDGGSIVICGEGNPLGEGRYANYLVYQWDLIRAEITSNGTVDPQQRAFLTALDKYLRCGTPCGTKALKSAAGKLTLRSVNLEVFITTLAGNRSSMERKHLNSLRTVVQRVLAGGPGFIGFPGGHAGTLEGINAATNTFTYSDPFNPTLVLSGELSGLIQAIKDGNIILAAARLTTRQDEAESSHAGEQRGRHLRQIHNQVIMDGKIGPAESSPLANLMEMGDDAFWDVYDSDKNGVIEGGELKAVQLRVDLWIKHFKSTPMW